MVAMELTSLGNEAFGIFIHQSFQILKNKKQYYLVCFDVVWNLMQL